MRRLNWNIQEISDDHNDYPLAPWSIRPDMWSAYMCTVDELDKAGKFCNAKMPKRVRKFKNKKRYVVLHQILVIVCGWPIFVKDPPSPKIQGENLDGVVHFTQH